MLESAPRLKEIVDQKHTSLLSDRRREVMGHDRTNTVLEQDAPVEKLHTAFREVRVPRVVSHHADRDSLGMELRSISITASPFFESRLPVGSSARRIAGSPARARATATRCCWPPESCDG